MTTVDRRTFLRVLGSGALAAAAPGSIDRALAIPAKQGTEQRFLRRLAGHVEDGRDSTSDPAIGDMGRANN